ncbi:lysine--tRNA ligase [Candidatus Korarchaeum cryptofilum]|uniref:Lysine--tRNA ligase n=1 Tax=Korarchaeum cryptofilum (strain OPF8) TaxID=374847 RepID=B1L6H9_KORCO|nr:lysine--tRNA ligase [Candidatus Korarchaeum cryptofilum]ACB08058.1 lysyl-tRNA synthetase [Candidatus Korarchaeum cryptofilum OPF8]
MSESGPTFWLDRIARNVVERERRIGRNLKVLRVESGIGASGFPHIGSVGDSLRAYGVKLALESMGYKSELIAYSDDRDGLRKVPAGIPEDYSKYLGMPVSEIPDPFGCHVSYGEHMSSILMDALEKLGIEFTFISGTEAYRSGLLDEQVSKLIANSGRVDRIIREEVGTNKPEGWIYYWPKCEKCGRIYTTRVIEVIPEEGKVIYKCDQGFKGVRGCGHVGEASYLRGEGKLSWKGEFAARWSALGIVFEPHGKDISDSFRVNARIAKEVLEYEPPLTVRYEMFLDRTGRKISKSAGNVITPQMWMDFSPPEALRMMMFKRYHGTRSISLQKSPLYINELELNLRRYHGLEKVGSERDRVTMRRLMEFTYLMEGVPNPPPYRYSAVLNVISMLPQELGFEEILRITRELISRYYDMKPEDLEKDTIFESYVRYAYNYVKYFGRGVREKIEIKKSTLDAINSFIEAINPDMSPDEMQNIAFEIAKKFEVPPKEFFSAIYLAVLGQPQGPRLGPLIGRLGVQRFKEILMRSLEERGVVGEG